MGGRSGRRRKGEVVLLHEEKEERREQRSGWWVRLYSSEIVSLLSIHSSAIAVHHCLILHFFPRHFAPWIKGTMLTWSLYLFGLIITPISASADEPPVDLTDEPGSRLLHNGESYFIYPERVWNYSLFLITWYFHLAETTNFFFFLNKIKMFFFIFKSTASVDSNSFQSHCVSTALMPVGL